MAEPKDGTSFLRKVARFVAASGAEGASPADDSTLMGLERSELKAMIERKRRNDFVRKREFDMLRKLRREGLSSVAALEALHLDTEPRAEFALAAEPPAETWELAPTIWRSMASILALMPTLCTDDWVERASTLSSMREDCIVNACAWSPDRPSRRMRRSVSSSRLRT
jgi:hypothetical protein